MRQAQLYKKLEKLENNFKQKKEKILMEYCDNNNPYKIGHYFTDIHGTILIEEIGYYLSGIQSTCTFTGTKVNKNGKLSEKGLKRTTYRSSEILYRDTLGMRLEQKADVYFKINEGLKKAGLKGNGDKI